jgi:hypothetical protein
MIINRIFNIKNQTGKWALIVCICLYPFISGCFKNLPAKNIVYKNDFERDSLSGFTFYNIFGRVDSTKITTLPDGNRVLGRFNSVLAQLKLDTLPEHNILKVEFDLYVHDKWDGNLIPSGSTLPDLWKMTINGLLVHLTTFSNGVHPQSFPNDFGTTVINNPPLSNSWGTLPGVCANAGMKNGTTHYKIEYTTGHTGGLILELSDVLQPFNSLCLKSWSIDNIRITATMYQ